MPYVTQSLDTTEKAERLQMEILRRFGPGKRAETMRSLSRSQMRMAWAGLKRDNPGLTERELQVKAVRIWYGEELAEQLERTLKEKNLWNS